MAEQFEEPIFKSNKNFESPIVLEGDFEEPITSSKITDTQSPIVPQGIDNSSYVDLENIFAEYGRKLTKEDILEDDRLMEVIRSNLESRFTPGGVLTKARRGVTGLTGGAVANIAPNLFFAMLLLVPFVDTMTTMLNEKLPLTPGEWEMWGNPIKSKEYFEYILSYAPYNNLDKKDYPPMLITTSLFDNRVLYSEPVKYIAKLRDLKSDNNIQLLKCKMEAAGHGGMSGRDNAITELAEEYSFILKSAKIFK